jgi:hypothetical protein
MVDLRVMVDLFVHTRTLVMIKIRSIITLPFVK